MRHLNALKKLNRTASHRRALMRNLATSLIIHESIETTLPKAKSLRRVVEKLVTMGKKGTLHHRREAMKMLFPVNQGKGRNSQKWTAVHRLFEEIAPRYAERQGGYTRVLRTRKRTGDNAQLALIQFVEGAVVEKAEKKRTRRVRKSGAEPESKAKTKSAAETPTKSAGKVKTAKTSKKK